MARLVDYNPYTQIANVQSCFHQQHPPETPLAEDVPEQEVPPPPPTTDTIDLISSESEAEQEVITMLTPPEKPTSNGSPVKNDTASSNTTTRQEGVIDLTSDVEEEEVDEIEYTQPGETSSWSTPDPLRSRRKSVLLNLDLTGKQPGSRRVDQGRQPLPSTNTKEKQRAEPRNVDRGCQTPRLDLKGKQPESGNVDQGSQPRPLDPGGKRGKRQKEGPPESPQTAPMVQLLVDTQLLGPRKYELRSLFEFSGQVVFDPTLEDDSSCLTVGSEIRNESVPLRENPGRWIMLAKSARNMEGLDLYAYRVSVLRIRELLPEA